MGKRKQNEAVRKIRVTNRRAALRRSDSGSQVPEAAGQEAVTGPVEAAAEALRHAESIVDTIHEPLLLLDASLRVHSMNEAFCQAFRVSKEDAHDRLLFELGNHRWNIPGLRALVEKMLHEQVPITDLELEHDFREFGRRTLLLNGRILTGGGGRPERILLAIEDITERQREKVALQRNEARMRALLSAMPDLMFRIHRDGTYLDFHAERASDLAMPPGEIIGSNIRQAPLPREVIDGALGAIERALATGAVQTLEYTLRSPEGPRHYESRIIASGKDEVVTIVRDVTERRRMEQWQTAQYAVTRVLAESQTIDVATPELLHAICEGLEWDLGELWHVDADAHLLRWQGTYNGSSFDAPQFIAMRRETTFAPSSGLPGRVWASGEPLWVDDVMADLAFRRAGSIARKVGLRSALGIPLRTRGEVLGVMVFFSRDTRRSEIGLSELIEALGRQIGDFIERKRAEEAWRTSEERFAAFMRHLPGVAFIKDALGRYLFVNETFEEVHHCKLADIAGKGDAELWPPEVARQLRQNDWLVMEGKRKLQVIETIPQEDGPHEWLASKFPIMDEDGTPIMLAGVAVDITEHKRAEASARQRQAELAHVLRVSTMGELAGGLAHELNQPLSAIANDMEACATYVRAGQGDAQVLLELLEHAAGEALRAGDIIHHLRDFVEKREPQVAAADLRDLIRSVARLLEPEMRRQQIALRLDPMPFPLPICADAIQIEQVLVNLVQNAVDAVVEAGSVRKEVRVQTALGENGRVEVAVVDAGRGAAAAVAERMFDPFFTTKPKGLGMGLAISRSIVEAHRGRLWMTPRADGISGTAVRLSLPLLAKATSKPRPPHEP